MSFESLIFNHSERIGIGTHVCNKYDCSFDEFLDHGIFKASIYIFQVKN